MTIKQLLKMTVEELEAMTDEQCLAYCQPFIIPVQKQQRTKATVIDTTGDTIRATKKSQSIEEFIAQAQRMMASKMEGNK